MEKTDLDIIMIKVRVMEFLQALNMITTGIITSDISEYDHPRFQNIVFESRLSSKYINGGCWSPSDLFWEKVHNRAKDHFLFYMDQKDWNFNNTKTIFSIDKVKV